MTQPSPDWNSSPPSNKLSSARVSAAAKRGSESRSLSLQDSYICPVCRHGQISALTLMDAFACNFCRHIFTANLQNQTVQVVDSSQPLTWRWTGRNWQSTYRDDPSLTAVVWFASIVLVLLPASIVWLMAFLFPPLPGSVLSWFPSVWLGCTFGIHLLMVGWLLAEHYQLPIYIASRVRLREWLGRR
ncbi:MAG: hypothetical protein EDM05_69180 [Leptolyngbya sp. IPPAS B-1204]